MNWSKDGKIYHNINSLKFFSMTASRRSSRRIKHGSRIKDNENMINYHIKIERNITCLSELIA